MMTANDTGEGLNLDNEDRLPWLEAAEIYEEEEAVSPLRLTLLVLTGLVLIGTVLGGLWWWQSGGPRGQGELIAAQTGPYKQPPASDGAKQFEGEGDASFAASEGAETSGKVDATRLPEEPAVAPAPLETKDSAPALKAPAVRGDAIRDDAAKGSAPAAKAPVVVSKVPPAKRTTVPTKMPPESASVPPSAPPTASGTVVQLGAFKSEASATKAWAALTKRFAYLADLGKSVVPATVNGGTVYRLRAGTGSAAAANDICAKMRVAGENCAVVR